MKRFAGTTSPAYFFCDSRTFLKNGFFADSAAAILSQVLRNSIRMSSGVLRIWTLYFSCSSLMASAFCFCHLAHHRKKTSVAAVLKISWMSGGSFFQTSPLTISSATVTF